MNMKDLKKEAKELKIKGYTKMEQGQLIEAISLAKVESQKVILEKDQPERKVEAPDNTNLAEVAGFHITSFILGHRLAFAIVVLAIVSGSFVFQYLTRPEPTLWEKLMGYLPF